MSNVLFFHRANDYTGSTRVLADIISKKYRNEKVTVITIDNNKGGFLSENKKISIKKIYSITFRGKNIPIVSTLIRKIHAVLLSLWFGRKYDTFYINTIVPYHAAWVGRWYGKMIIYHIHEKYKEMTASSRLMEKVFNGTKAHRIFVSKYCKDQYPERIDSSWEIQYNKLSDCFINKIILREIKDRSLNTVLMVSSLSKIKGVYNFVELPKRMPEYKFILVLSVSEERIKEVFGSITLKNLEILPTQSDLHSIYNKADLILNLSTPPQCVETFGMTILEAMAYGIPAVVPNVGGPIEMIENGVNGYLVDVNNLESVTQSIKKALEPKNYKCLSFNSIKIFNEKFR